MPVSALYAFLAGLELLNLLESLPPVIPHKGEA